MRIAACLEYQGAGFEGWQTQLHRRTVQDAVEAALREVAGEAVSTICAGRTDAGVHATAQVIHFDSRIARPLSAWVRGVNSHLPAAAAVRWAVEVSSDFHARFSARSRCYRYILLNRAVRPALLAERVGWFHLPLDVARMAQAAQALLGEHDFSAFRAAQCQARTPVRRLSEAAVRRIGEFVVFDFRANGFLHHMVRNLVGALVYVGKGRQPVDWLEELLAGRDRSRAAPTFSAAGLYFCGAEYSAEWSLPEAGRIIAYPPLPAT